MAAEDRKDSNQFMPEPSVRGAQAVGVRLIPANDSDLPIVANFTRVHSPPSVI